jgi:hypothetical protein
MQGIFSLKTKPKPFLPKRILIKRSKRIQSYFLPGGTKKKSIPAALFQRIDIKPCQGEDKVAENAMLEQVSQLRIADK